MKRKIIYSVVFSLLMSFVMGTGISANAYSYDDFWSDCLYENDCYPDEWYQKTTPLPTDDTYSWWWEEDIEPTPSPVPEIKPGLNKATLGLGKRKKYTLKVKNVQGKITWSSSNKKIASVSKNGVVKGKKAGKATIKAKCNNPNVILKCKVTVYSGVAPETIRKKILKMKSKYPEGKHWTNSNWYYSKAINCYCYGCIGFVGIVSDKVFGRNKKVKKHHSFDKIKSGDHIRIGDYHSVIVLSKNGNKLTVAEGNYNFSIHWGRKISKSELKRDGFYVETRY